jgi:uncharacterized membrane protein YhaH (DUF805 family)
VTVIGNIKYHFANLLSFAGREPRRRFWPYAAFVFVSIYGGMMLAFVPVMGAMRQFVEAHPDRATVQSAPGGYSVSIHGNPPELHVVMSSMIKGVAVVAMLAVVLLASAVARRLHDRGKSGAWGLMPLPFLSFGFFMMPTLFAQSEPDMTLFFAVFINNFVYIGLLITLIVMLCGASSEGENKFGAPVAER